jgi:hypothetical protein
LGSRNFSQKREEAVDVTKMKAENMIIHTIWPETENPIKRTKINERGKNPYLPVELSITWFFMRI